MQTTHISTLSAPRTQLSLFSCCNVMWLDNWSEKSMHVVVQRQLTDVSDSTKSNLPQLLTSFHKSQFMHGASPGDFVTLLQTCKAIYKRFGAMALFRDAAGRASIEKWLTDSQANLNVVRILSPWSEELSFAEIFFDLKRTRIGTCGSSVYRSSPTTNANYFSYWAGQPSVDYIYLVKGQDQGDLGALDPSRCGRFHITQVSASARTLGTSVTQITLQMF